jgi:hypothetical protein
LRKYDAEFIVIGGVGAALCGAPITTLDVDVLHRRTPENAERLLKALADLDAIYRMGAYRRIRPNESYLLSPGHQLLLTNQGSLDLLGTVGEGLSYEDMLPHSEEMAIAADVSVRVLNLDKLIELKRQAGRDKDLAVLPVLEAVLKESRRRGQRRGGG